MRTSRPEDWPVALSALQRAAKPTALVYLTVELVDKDNDLEAAYDAARAKGWPVVPGEHAEDYGYHYYPERAAVRVWLDETRLDVVEQSDGDGYCTCSARQRLAELFDRPISQ